MDAQTLLQHYHRVSEVHALTGFVSKVGVGSCLLLMTRAEGPGIRRLIPMVIAAQAFVFAMIDVGSVSWAVAVGGLVLGFCSAYVAFDPEGSWEVLPKAGKARGIAFAIYVWAFWFPVFILPRDVLPVLFAPFKSAMGALPQPTLLIALVLAWSSWPNTPRLFGWAAVAASLIIGIADLCTGVWSSALVVVLALYVGKMMMPSAANSNWVNDDRPPADVKTEKKKEKQSKRAIDEAKGGTEKVWKLK